MQNLGFKIKELRLKNKLSQSKLAKSIGITRQAVNLWEKGKTTPRFSKIQKLAEVLSSNSQEILQILFNN